MQCFEESLSAPAYARTYTHTQAYIHTYTRAHPLPLRTNQVEYERRVVLDRARVRDVVAVAAVDVVARDGRTRAEKRFVLAHSHGRDTPGVFTVTPGVK